MSGDLTCEFTTAYVGVRVKAYKVNTNQKITITQPNGDIYEWVNNISVEPSFIIHGTINTCIDISVVFFIIYYTDIISNLINQLI